MGYAWLSDWVASGGSLDAPQPSYALGLSRFTPEKRRAQRARGRTNQISCCLRDVLVPFRVSGVKPCDRQTTRPHIVLPGGASVGRTCGVRLSRQLHVRALPLHGRIAWPWGPERAPRYHSFSLIGPCSSRKLRLLGIALTRSLMARNFTPPSRSSPSRGLSRGGVGPAWNPLYPLILMSGSPRSKSCPIVCLITRCHRGPDQRHRAPPAPRHPAGRTT